jgi:hypothetical protein
VTLQRGDRVEVSFTKWGGAAHWSCAMTFLGRDDHGVWAGAAVGATVSRPGVTFDSQHDWVSLVPEGLPWSASFYDSPANDVSVFVDMTTVPVWSGAIVTMVDLDLDVVLRRDGTLFVDDEDEFDVHRVALGYPDEIVDLARRSSDDVLGSIADGAEPFASAGARWLDVFRSQP